MSACKFFRWPKGFTLIELLVVISIIGVLATLIISNMNAARERARDVRRKTDLNSVKVALSLYYSDKGQFPDASGGQIVGCGDTSNPSACSWGEAFGFTIPTDKTYLSALPKDPLDPDRVYAYVRPDADSFVLSATLENTGDGDAATSQSKCGLAAGGVYEVCAD